MDSVDLDPMVSAAAVPSDVRLVKFETIIAARIGDRSTNSPKTIEVSDNMPSEKIDKVSLQKTTYPLCLSAF